jgi:GT2 family glycosyltransferase
MKKLHVIVVAYKRAIPLRLLIDSFVLQTDTHWFMTIIHDGPAPEDVKKVVDSYISAGVPNIRYIETTGINGCYGHVNRKMMLEAADPADGEFLLFTNDDNYYVIRFVEYMLAAANKKNVGIVYCDMVHSHIAHDVLKAKLKVNHIDIGAFIVDINLAQSVGFNHFTYAGDGLFAEELAARAKKLRLRKIYIPKPLFCHN